MNRQGCLYPFFAIFAIAGLVCGAVGVSGLLSKQHILNEGLKTTGTILDLDRSSKGSVAPVIGFQDEQGNDRVYHSNTYTSESDYQIGQALTIWYLPSDPESEVALNAFDWADFFPFIFLFSHGGVGIGGLVWLERKRRLRKWLNEYGQEVKARFTKVDTHSGKSTSYSILCEWKDPYTGLVHEFRSDHSSSNPEGLLASHDGLLRVLIDPANPKRYWVDTAFLKG
ncbi:MAG: DUF3592 domain-containing protein [Phycisphaerae bacterium]|nr:DUF3592 domain-containing protein [Saprospiraceae bacterium]